MLKRLFGIIAVMIFSFFMQGTVWANANNLVVNGTFVNGVGGMSPWTFTEFSQNGIRAGYAFGSRFDPPYSPPTGTTSTLAYLCNDYCFHDRSVSASQIINGLSYGKSYEVTFWGFAGKYTRWSNEGLKYPTSDPMHVSLGSQTSEAIILPNHYVEWPYPWTKKSVIFKYLDRASSAVLSFIQNYDNLLPVACTTCFYGADLHISDVVMTEVVSSPVLTVTEALNGNRIADTDQFTVQITQNSTTIVNATTNSTTTGSGATVTPGTGTTGATSLLANTTYSIKEVASGTANLARYDSTLTCLDAVGLSKTLPLNTGFTLSDGDAITCTLTNTPKVPTLRLTKALGTAGRINNTDQFTVLIQQRLGDVASGTTAGTGSSISAGTTGWTPLVSGTGYTLNEVMTAGSASKLGRYTGVVGCSNTFAGSPTSVPLVPGTAFTPTYGDVLDCTLTNKPTLATLTVTQKTIVTAPATFNPPVKFSYTGTNGWTLQQNSSTVLNTVTTGARQTLTALNVDTALSVAVPTTETGWRIVSIRCTDTNATLSTNPLPPTVLVSSTTNSITIPAAYVVAGAALQCAVIGSRLQ